MIHCHCEPLERLLPELPPLLQAHWDESEAALFGPQVYALDTKRYACWERLGMLHVVTVWKPEEISDIGNTLLRIAEGTYRSGTE